MDKERSTTHPDGNAARQMRRANRVTALTLACRCLHDAEAVFPDYAAYVTEATQLAELFLPWLDTDVPGAQDQPRSAP